MLEKKDYDNLIGELESVMSKSFLDTCFYIYGSYAEGRADYGRSDIDGGFILRQNCVTDKEEVKMLSSLFKDFMKRGIELQFNLTDRGTNQDGRFLSYTTDYTDHIKKRGKRISGPDYIREMSGIDYKSGTLHTLSFNFRKIRNYALEFFYNQENDKKRNNKNIKTAIKTLSGTPKKLLWLRGYDIIVKKEEALEELKLLFGPSNTSDYILELNKLIKNPKKLDKFVNNCDFDNYSHLLEAYERMLKMYIEKFPLISLKEAKI